MTTITPLAIPDVLLITPKRHGDARGWFAETWSQRALAGTAAVVALPAGRGMVVATADNLNFRGFWYGTNRVFMNALYFSEMIRY